MMIFDSGLPFWPNCRPIRQQAIRPTSTYFGGKLANNITSTRSQINRSFKCKLQLSSENIKTAHTHTHYIDLKAHIHVKQSAKLKLNWNKTISKQFWNCFETVLKLFCFSQKKTLRPPRPQLTKVQ